MAQISLFEVHELQIAYARAVKLHQSLSDFDYQRSDVGPELILSDELVRDLRRAWTEEDADTLTEVRP